MLRNYPLFIGVLLLVVGGAKVWLHLNTGDVLTLDGCLGGTFSVPIGRASAHCWGCYVAAFGAVISAAAILMPSVTPYHALLRGPSR